ncbi:hypothetical protein PAA26_00150 [Methanomassiliicoccaceae archaeon COG_1]|nr:hypothetical protein [Methanomassiliicoccaceae archaeon COG_1]
MEDSLCNIELFKDNDDFIVRIQSDMGGKREFKSANFEDLLSQISNELQEEFDSA